MICRSSVGGAGEGFSVHRLSSSFFFFLSRRSFLQPSSVRTQIPRRLFSATAFNVMTYTDDFTPQHLYEPLEEVERLEDYRPGGYHPVKIGDQFHHGRYRILHKLGHGSYSTMWLARDEQVKKYVALKVCTADPKPRDIGILSDLTNSRRSSKKSPGETMIPSIMDKFSIRGPNGNHDCYVSAVARTSLAGAKDGSWIRLFQQDVARALAAQLVLAIEYMHGQGYVHGDLHLGNILLKMPPGFDKLSIERLYEDYGAPEPEPVVRFDGKPLPSGVPSHGIAPIWLGEASEDILIARGGASILLTDFGEAFSPSQELKYESRTPLVMRPPEAFFEPEKPLSFPSDIWTLACSIWDIIAQRPLFEGFLATEDVMICEHVDALGILPPEWWEKWEARHKRFTEDGTPINRNSFRSWDDRFEDSVQEPRRDGRMSTFDAEERNAVSSMLRSMLFFRPENRPTARQVLGSEWMVRWALPQYYNNRHTVRQ